MNSKNYGRQKSEQSRLEQLQIFINDKIQLDFSFSGDNIDYVDLINLLNSQIELIFAKNKVKFEKKESSSQAQGQNSRINFSRLKLHTSKLDFSNNQTKNVYNIFKKILKIFEVFTQNSKESEQRQKVDILMELFQKMMDDMKEGLGEKIESLNTLFKLDLYGQQLQQQLKDKKMINKRKELLLRLQNQKSSMDQHMKFQRQLSEKNLSNMSINHNEDNLESLNDSMDKKISSSQYRKQQSSKIRNKRFSQPVQIYDNYQYAQIKNTNLFVLSSERDLNKDNYIVLDKNKLELSDQFDEFLNNKNIQHRIVQIYDKKKITKRIRYFQNKFYKAISEQILHDCDTREQINKIEKNLLKIIQKIKLLGNKKDLLREIQIQKQEIQILQQKLKITGNVSHEIKKLNQENSDLRKNNEELSLEYKVLQSRFELVQSSKEYNVLDENYSISEDDQLEPPVQNEKSIIELKIQKYNDGLSNLDAVAEEQSDYERSQDSIKINKNFFTTKLYEIYFNYNFNQQKQGEYMKKSKSTIFCQDKIFKSLYKKDVSGDESPIIQEPINKNYKNQRSKSFSLPQFLDTLEVPEPKITSTINKKTISTNLKVKINKLQNVNKKLKKLRTKLIKLSQIKKKTKTLQQKLKVFKKKKIIQKIENKSDFESLSSHSNFDKPKNLLEQLKLSIQVFTQQHKLKFAFNNDFRQEFNNLLNNLEKSYKKSQFGRIMNDNHESISSKSEDNKYYNQSNSQQNQFRQTDFNILQKAFISLSEALQNLTSNVNFLQKKFKEQYREKITNEILLNIQKNIQQLKKQSKLIKFFIIEQKDLNKTEYINEDFNQLTSSNYQPLLYNENKEQQGPQRTFSAPRNKEKDLFNPKLAYENSIYEQGSQKNYMDDNMQKYTSCLDLLKTMSMTEIPNNENNIYSSNQDSISLDNKIDFLMKIASQLFPSRENKLQILKSQILEHFHNPNYLERSLRNSIPQSEASTKRNFERDEQSQNDLITKLQNDIKNLENKLKDRGDEQMYQKISKKYKERESKLQEQNKKLKKCNLVYQRKNNNMISTINRKTQQISVLEKEKQELETRYTELQNELDNLMESQDYLKIQQTKSQKSLIQVLKLENQKQIEKISYLKNFINSLKSKHNKKIIKLKKQHQETLENFNIHKSQLLIKQSQELQQMDSLKRQQAQKNQNKSKRFINTIKSDIKPKRTSQSLLTKSMLQKGSKYQIIFQNIIQSCYNYKKFNIIKDYLATCFYVLTYKNL